jgi:hypothetical protein
VCLCRCDAAAPLTPIAAPVRLSRFSSIQVCPKPELDKKAHAKCLKPFGEYEACAKRVAAGAVEASKNCGGYYGEYWQCIDKTVRTDTHRSSAAPHTRDDCVSVLMHGALASMLLCLFNQQNAKELFKKLR